MIELLAEAWLADLDREANALLIRTRLLDEWRRGAVASPARGGPTMTTNTLNTLPQTRSDVGPMGEGTPGFVSRRRAWLHRVLAAQKSSAETPREAA